MGHAERQVADVLWELGVEASRCNRPDVCLKDLGLSPEEMSYLYQRLGYKLSRPGPARWQVPAESIERFRTVGDLIHYCNNFESARLLYGDGWCGFFDQDAMHRTLQAMTPPIEVRFEGTVYWP